MIIQWKQGSKINADPEKCYRELERIRAKEGNLKPESIINAAKRKNSPMHKVFNWDDKSAAHEYRLTQARYITRSIEVTYDEKPDVPVRAYESITIEKTTDEPKRKVYQSTEQILKTPSERDELLGNAIRDALAFKRRYRALSELSIVFSAVDEFLKKAKI